MISGHQKPLFIRGRGFQQNFCSNVFCVLMDDKFSICIYEESWILQNIRIFWERLLVNFWTVFPAFISAVTRYHSSRLLPLKKNQGKKLRKKRLWIQNRKENRVRCGFEEIDSSEIHSAKTDHVTRSIHQCQQG